MNRTAFIFCLLLLGLLSAFAMKQGQQLMTRAPLAIVQPQSTITNTAQILCPYYIQGSYDLINWFPLTNVYFSANFVVANNGSNLFLRGWYTNADVTFTNH